MAIKYEQIINVTKLADSKPLSETELGYINEVEKYIDNEILKTVNSDWKAVYIDLGYVTFKYPVDKKYTIQQMTSARKDVLQEELLRRYSEAGWKVDYQFDDGLDGPNMSGPDYAIFKGK